MEIWFYHLQRQPLEQALPGMLEKAIERGWRVVVQTVDDLRQKALDDLLWTYRPESFLAHGSAKEKGSERQPIVITCANDNPNGAQLRIYVEGADIQPGEVTRSCERLVLMFDGANEEEVVAARRQWSRLKAADAGSLTYWQQSDTGRWERKM